MNHVANVAYICGFSPPPSNVYNLVSTFKYVYGDMTDLSEQTQ